VIGRCAFLALLAAAPLLAGCGRPSEAELRFEAERLRWRIDREEEHLRGRDTVPGPGEIEYIRSLHDEVHRRFGVETPPDPGLLQDPDSFRRLRIAAASSLYRADLAAEYSPSDEVVAEYGRIADVYSFDREIALRALFGKGRLLELLGRPREALENDALLLERYPPVAAWDSAAAMPPPPADWLLDLEIHALVLARRIGSGAPARFTERTMQRLEHRAREWEGTARAPLFLDRWSQALAVQERWAEAIAPLEQLRDLAGMEASARASLRIGEIVRRGLSDPERAVKELERAASDGKGTEVEAQALLRLAEIEIERGHAAEAQARVHTLTDLRAQHLEERRAEALYLHAKASASQGRWEDAIPSFARIADVDSEGGWAIRAQHEIVRQRRATGRVSAAQDAERTMLAIARRVPDVAGTRNTAFGWDGYWNEPRERERWTQCIAALRAAGRSLPDSAEAANARNEADRIERTRIHPEAGTTESRIKPASSGAETAMNRETP
jgi:tetratricopeptide (TPR) repeat protein